MRSFFSLPVVAILIVLGITNPTTNEYSAWVRQQVSAASTDDPLVRLVAYAVADPVIQATTERQNLLVFSIFVTRLNATHQSITLGVASNFFAIPLPTSTPWRPGSPSPNFRHVIAQAVPDTWKPEDGYVWLKQPPNGDLRVRWAPGRLSEKFPHVIATSAEERWLPEDGYVWDQDPPPIGQLGVHWQPGRSSSKFANIVAAVVEGSWLPADGYRWITEPSRHGGLRVEPIAQSTIQKNQRAGANETASAERKNLPNANVAQISLAKPNCSKDFIQAWAGRNPRVFPLPYPQSPCTVHSNTGAYVCDADGCRREPH